MRSRRILSIVGRQIFRLAGAGITMTILGSAAPAGAGKRRLTARSAGNLSPERTGKAAGQN